MGRVFSTITLFFKRISKIMNAVVNFIVLFIVYAIGVGFTSIIAKLFQKKFLSLKKGSWVKCRKMTREGLYRQF